MDVLTLAMWIGTAIFLIFSFAKDKGKTKQALKMAFGMGKGMLGSILSIIFLIGLMTRLSQTAQIQQCQTNDHRKHITPHPRIVTKCCKARQALAVFD